LLVVIFAIAVFASVRIHGQLAEAASVERSLVKTRQGLDHVLQLQIDQQTAVRGFLLTGEQSFLAAYDEDDRVFDSVGKDLRAAVDALHDGELDATIEDLQTVHETWENEIARPLVANRRRSVVTLEQRGKVLVDQLRGDAQRIGDLLDERLDRAQIRVQARIDESLFTVLALALLFASAGIIFVATRARLQARIDRERAIVETLESAFRSDLDALPGARVGSAYSSATRDAAVGGDLFDVRRLDATTGLILIADVSGKGIEAAVNTAFVKYALGTLARSIRDPAALLAAFNAQFMDTIAEPSSFVVVFAGILDAASQRLTYGGAGHGGAFLRRGTDVRVLPATGPAIGLDRSLGFESAVVDLQPGDQMVLATDGFTEARNAAGTMLGDAAIALLRSAPADPQACADRLVEDLRVYCGGALADDLALLVISIGDPA
jgi:serine phosphatase RsbU (regulator of sigma subunit)